ncbi:MAG: hypothetical protein HYY30_07605 [Chloroflexi bacterium]|nr:hypothetical protein [Chloroflexota bacterium]
MISISPVVEVATSLRKRNVSQVFASLAFLLVSWPIISLFHESVVAFTALLLNGFFQSGMVYRLAEEIGADTVYASVAIQMAANIRVEGISVAGPIGEALHQALPTAFAPPDLVSDGAWTSAVVEAGSPLLARTITRISAAWALICAGIVLMQPSIAAIRQRSLANISIRHKALLFLGLALQARAIGAILSLQFTAHYLEAMGLPQFLTKVVPSTPQSYEAFVARADPVLSLLAPFWLLQAAYASSFLGVMLVKRITGKACGILAMRHLMTGIWRRAIWLPLRKKRPPRHSSASVDAKGNAHRGASAWPYVVVVALVFLATATDLASARTNYDYVPDQVINSFDVDINSSDVDVDIDGATTSADATASRETAAPRPLAKPSVVTISGTNYNYGYFVNGEQRRIRGVGYNVQYRHLSPEQRVALYTRDFRAMRERGINTITGWDEREFDYYTLAVATQFDIGVVLPYNLPADINYADPAIAKGIKSDILAWVAKYKGSPALRMWGIGNEVIHGTRSADSRKAFADFYRDVVDAVRTADPDHPIIYREAEDVFIPQIKKAFTRSKSESPWLVYGANIFTYRLKQVLENWKKQGLDMPLVISEFAPTGLSKRDRPAGYLNMWSMMRENSSLVIGGFMYVWTTTGPETLDRVYGLVDENGKPTDGSLEAMGAQFLKEAQESR